MKVLTPISTSMYLAYLIKYHLKVFLVSRIYKLHGLLFLTFRSRSPAKRTHEANGAPHTFSTWSASLPIFQPTLADQRPSHCSSKYLTTERYSALHIREPWLAICELDHGGNGVVVRSSFKWRPPVLHVSIVGYRYPTLGNRFICLRYSSVDNPSSSLSEYTPHPTLTPRITSLLAPTRAVHYCAAYARPPRNGKASIPCFCCCLPITVDLGESLPQSSSPPGP
ncbi:hypothetical protein CSIM01_02681 [Colletotrichum simmondsii]|uniref:Uncharacterized protein n=1 Tax=Colletotrichum simmondsii TaxID=703756 RepID=A0A135RVA9_9PEZI|nr:hypothetical protein CSIM01_02681 [Colletotrichum simmondsii]